MTAQELGALGEKFVLEMLKSVGLDAELGGPGDIVLGNGLVLEVKAARLSRRTDRRGKRRYQFSLWRCARCGRVKTDARRADIIVLLAYNGAAEPVLYAVPRKRIGNRRQIALPENLIAYTGQWSWFKGWERCIQELGL